MEFQINYGLGGGFGGMIESEIIEADSLEEANTIAHLMALENSEGYEGQNGFPSVEVFMEEDKDIDKKTAQMMYNEEMENMLEYEVISLSKKEKDD